MKCLAAILVEQKQPLRLEEIEIPRLAQGQVLVQVLCSGICGSQLGEIDGAKGPDAYLPHLLGHEGAGIVRECGPGVRHVKVGDKVVLHWRKGLGLESLPPKYQSALGSVNAGWVTTFNEYAVVSENRVTAVPADFDPEVASLFGCAVTTGFGVVNNNAQLRIGESVVVLGAGGIGLSVIQGARLAGAYPIIAVDLVESRMELATKLGAHFAIHGRSADLEAEILRIAGKDGVDVAIDNTGNPRVIELGYRVTKATGRTVLVGVPSKGQTVSIETLPLHFEKSISGSHGGECRPERDIPNYVRLTQAGLVDFRQCLARRFPLTDINLAIQQMRDGTLAGRAIIAMSDF